MRPDVTPQAPRGLTRTRGWLNDSQFFDPLARSDADALYRIRPEFLSLYRTPNPEFIEALQQAIRPSATVYFAPGL